MKQKTVIDSNAIYKTYVVVDDGIPQFYNLLPGEVLIDAEPPQTKIVAGGNGFLRPLWNGKSWEESATKEEIIAWESEHKNPSQKTLHELKSERQTANKAALAAWLAAHPLTWVDGNVYGVTEEDQNEMSLNLQQYQVQVAAGRSVDLEWHTQKKQCHTFTKEQYTALLLAIIDYVYPYRRYQEAVKAAIYAAETTEAVEAVVIDYAGVIVEEGDADA